MKLKSILVIAALIALGGMLLLAGRNEGLIAWGLALLPAGRQVLERQRSQGQRQQATADRAGAQRQRDDLKARYAELDEKTRLEVATIRAKWEAMVGRPPTIEEENEMVERFSRRR